MTKLNADSLRLLRETAEAEREVGSRNVATALDLILKWYDDREWHPIETAPPNVWVEVCGNSGYGDRKFLAVAIHDSKYRPRDPWQDVTMTGLSENGWVPTHWRPRSSFPS